MWGRPLPKLAAKAVGILHTPFSTWKPSCSSTWQYSAADFTSCRDSSGLAQMVSATWQITSFLASMAAMAACFFASIKSFSFV